MTALRETLIPTTNQPPIDALLLGRFMRRVFPASGLRDESE